MDDIRRMNKVLLSDPADLATKAHGYGLFVHNWEGVNSAASTSNSGITYVPAYPTSQGISIQRSDTEVVLMSTGGGRFTLPKSIQVKTRHTVILTRRTNGLNKEILVWEDNSCLTVLQTRILQFLWKLAVQYF